MTLNIEDPETDRLARALADATGETIEAAVRTAIEQRLTRECSTERERKLEAVREIVDRVARLPRKTETRAASWLKNLYDETAAEICCRFVGFIAS